VNSAKHRIAIASKTVTVTVTTSCTGRQHEIAVSAYSPIHWLLSSDQPLINERLDEFLRRCQRLCYCDDNLPSIVNLFDDADNQLFKSILANILHHYPTAHQNQSFSSS